MTRREGGLSHDTLTVGVQVTNPSDNPAANLYLGVVMPDGQTALFLVPGGATAPVSLGDHLPERHGATRDSRFASTAGRESTGARSCSGGRSQGAWNNFADCAQLFDPTGARRYRLSYNGAC